MQTQAIEKALQPQTIEVSPEEMNKRIARFRQLRPQSEIYEKQGIPSAAYEMVAAKALYTLMAPSNRSGPMSATPPVIADDRLSVVIAECPPGNKPMLHAHFKTTEHFFCLTGRFLIRWGDQGEHQTTLEPFDMIAVPRAVARDFTNISDEKAYLLVLITGDSEESYNDIGFAPSESRRFKERFGEEVAGKLESIGFSFLNERKSPS
jgi:mannose-6-phosphate isomerase-like protein (cupin superfamily)